jgi:GNAT superfamily N-acetyltransferase
MEAELNLHFLAEHNYLVLLDDRDYVVGGLVYLEESERDVRIERYVVAPHRRKKGVARLLVDEFCNRMAGRGKDVVRLPFMHPRYHESLGFVIDHANGGLLKHLGPTPGATGAGAAGAGPGAPKAVAGDPVAAASGDGRGGAYAG